MSNEISYILSVLGIMLSIVFSFLLLVGGLVYIVHIDFERYMKKRKEERNEP